MPFPSSLASAASLLLLLLCAPLGAAQAVVPAAEAAKLGKELTEVGAERAGNKDGTIPAYVGKASFSDEQLSQNIKAFVDAVIKAKPPAAKGTYVKKLSISSSMGPGLKLDLASVTGGA
jgi:large subunit ribosomal protein L1